MPALTVRDGATLGSFDAHGVGRLPGGPCSAAPR